ASPFGGAAFACPKFGVPPLGGTFILPCNRLKTGLRNSFKKSVSTARPRFRRQRHNKRSIPPGCLLTLRMLPIRCRRDREPRSCPERRNSNSSASRRASTGRRHSTSVWSPGHLRSRPAECQDATGRRG